MKQRVRLDKLHPGQLEIARAFNESPRVVIRCGRRFGKTTLLERTAIKRAVNGQRVGWFGPQYRLNTPTYNRILRAGRPAVARKSKIDQIIEFKSGGCVEFWTLNDEDAGRSRFYDLAILDEASLVESGLRDTWEQAIAPTLLDRGGSAIMAGTPKGIDDENFFYQACNDKSLGWVEFHAPTAANPLLDRQAVDNLVNEYPSQVYLQEYLAEFVDWSGSAFFAIDNMLVDNAPVDIDWRVDQVFATIDTAQKDGVEHDGTGVIIWAKSKYAGHPLVILDWDVVQVQASVLIDWLPGINRLLEGYAAQYKAREGSLGCWIEDMSSGIQLLQSAKAAGLQAWAIDSKLTASGKEGRAIAASPFVYQGKVKLSRLAFDKVKNYCGATKNHLLDQVCGFRMGQKKRDHLKDLLDCFTYGVCLALGNAKGF